MDKTEFELIIGSESKVQGKKFFLRNEDFEIPHGDDYKLAIELLQELKTNKIMNTTMPTLFVYDDVSLWWFIYQSLIPELKKSVNFTQKLFEYVEDHKPTKITVENFEYFELIRQICNIKKIKLGYSKYHYKKFQIKNSLKITLKKDRNTKITQAKIKKRKNLFNQFGKKFPDFNNKLLFAISTNFRRSILDSKTGKSIRGEYIQQSIIDIFLKESVGIDLDYTFKGEHEILKERLSETIFWSPLEMIIGENQNEKNRENFLKNYNKIISNNQFQKLFDFKQVSLWDKLSTTFEEMKYTSYLPFYLNLLDSLKIFLAKHKPKAIFLPYETGPLALAFIVEARKLGIKTIGIQHGYIYQNNPMYAYDEFQTDENLHGFPIPDYILVFGQDVKNLLVETGYPEEKLIVFGNPAFFGLSNLKNQLSNTTLLKNYNIDPHKKIILFTTGKLQPYYSHHGNYDYDVKIWKYLLEKFSHNSDYMIILKPHPQESNISVYEDLLNEFSNCDAKIIQGNIYELIHLSSVVISVFSSTMLDSLCFDKNVIRVKFQDDFNSVFDKSGAITTINLNELFSTVEKIFSSHDFQESLSITRKQFVKKQYGLPENEPQSILENLLDKS